MVMIGFIQLRIYLCMSNEKQRRGQAPSGNSKKADLAKEFQDFKQKIQEFENKNEQIINRIRDACTFKKKNVNQQNLPPRVVYYQKGDSVDSGHSSDQYTKNMAYNGNIGYYSSQVQQGQYQPYLFQSHQVYRPAQYAPNSYSKVIMDQNSKEHQNPYYRSSFKASTVQPVSKAYSTQGQLIKHQQHIRAQKSDNNGSRGGRNRKETGKFWESSTELEEKLRVQVDKNRQLEQILDDREEELSRMRKSQNKFKTYASTLRRSVADQIDNYHEEVVIHRMLEMEKIFKRYDNKLKNLNLRLRDVLEDRKAHRLIDRSKKRRRSSLSRNKVTSEGQNKQDNRSGINNIQKTSTKSQSKQQQFAQIAAGYETMVKSKEQQIQKLENKVREQIQIKQKYSLELKRIKLSLEQKDNIIEELREVKSTAPPELFSEVQDSNQLEEALIKMEKMEEMLRSKQLRERELNNTIQRLEKAKKALQEEQKQSMNKSLNKKNSAVVQLEQKLRQCESYYSKEISQLRDRLTEADKKIMEKQCEILTLGNKLKKAQNDTKLKDQKLKELESIMTKDNDSDILDTSMSVDNSIMTGADVRLLQEAVGRLQDELDHKVVMIEQLEKKAFDLQTKYKYLKEQNEKLSKTIEHMEKKLNQKQNEFRENHSDRDITRQLQERIDQLEEVQFEKADLIEERQSLVEKNNELLQDVKRLKEENLALNRQLIKVNSQVGFNQGQYANLQQKFSKVKEEVEQLKKKFSEQNAQHAQQQKNLYRKVKQLQAELEVCRLAEIEGSTPKISERQEQNLLHSFHTSEVSFNINPARGVLEEQLTSVKEKLREMEVTLEVKENMEKQVQDQYKANLEKIRIDKNEKCKEVEKLEREKEELKRKIKQLQQQQSNQDSMDNYKISLYQEKIMQLQAENNSCKESEERLNELLHELTQNMKEKQEEKERLLSQLQQKQRVIEQMKDIIQLKQVKEQHSFPERQSLSLRFSGEHSQQFNSQAEISYMSNISDVFKRDDVLQDKMKKGKTSREEFIRLFAKTSAYIKSLKGIISTKNQRIANLEKRVVNSRKEENMPPSWNQAKEKTKRLEINMFKTCEWKESQDDFDEFKDYDSLQLDVKKTRSHDMVKQIQKEKELAVEENKMLLNQIELLQEQIARSEQQENNLVRIKDLYKDQIKKLMENNEAHTKQFQEQIQKLRDQLDQSESYHNWQAVRQLFGKTINFMASILDEPSKGKREQKRKELEQFVKIFTSILKIEGGARDKLLSSIRH